MTLLIESGLPESKKDSVVFRTNGQVNINELENDICLKLIETLHAKIFMGRKLYCNGVIPLTPEKSDIPPVVCESTLPSSAVAVKSSSSAQALSPLRPDGASNFAIHAGQPSIVLNIKAYQNGGGYTNYAP